MTRSGSNKKRVSILRKGQRGDILRKNQAGVSAEELGRIDVEVDCRYGALRKHD